jgi:MOSC domain-containing protein YiiM
MSEVVSIHITAEGAGPMIAVSEVRAVPGKGLEGDRYFSGSGTWSKKPGPDREVTLIESEAIEAIARDNGVEIAPGQARRNIVTKGVALNHLVGKEFRVGEVTLRGMRLAEPCGHLESLSKPGVKEGLVHRGGLRAQILKEGTIRNGDQIEETAL